MIDLPMLFCKDVSRYDRHHSLALPTSLMAYVWPPEVVPDQRLRKFLVVDMYDQSWTFEGHLRWGDGYPKPEVRGPGWRDFIRNKGLRVGDKLVFYLPPPKGPAAPPAVDGDSPPLVFVISVMRTIRLGGATFAAHLAPLPPKN